MIGSGDGVRVGVATPVTTLSRTLLATEQAILCPNNI